jgi:phosphopantothenoylcysteine decarboxylase/phosphopantothenate--cysteine ligase
MGFAIAAAAAAAGASVTLVSGPVALPTPAGVERVAVESAQEMHRAVMGALQGTELFIGCAAVADYRPVAVADQKIKKNADEMTLRLERNPDILADVAATRPRPFCVGFAAETQDVENYAEHKRRTKGVDMVAANRVGAALGFDEDQNELLVLWEGGQTVLPRQDKGRLATHLVELIADRFDAQTAA